MREQNRGGHIFNMDGAGADGNATPRLGNTQSVHPSDCPQQLCCCIKFCYLYAEGDGVRMVSGCA